MKSILCTDTNNGKFFYYTRVGGCHDITPKPLLAYHFTYAHEAELECSRLQGSALFAGLRLTVIPAPEFANPFARGAVSRTDAQGRLYYTPVTC